MLKESLDFHDKFRGFFFQIIILLINFFKCHKQP